ncbi:IRF7 factor, partial [Polyodon spathula]|nr:IRF7 factor [Polyodon spathula]
KPQFSKWLIEQINSGQYPGLEWVDRDCFRIPWKHNSRKDCNDDDCMIFKAWAIASEKFHENQNDKAKWKTNFRGALNSLKNFIKIQDKSKELDDPHKVYQIVEMPSEINEHRSLTSRYAGKKKQLPLVISVWTHSFRIYSGLGVSDLNVFCFCFLHTARIVEQAAAHTEYWKSVPRYKGGFMLLTNLFSLNIENEPLLPDLNDLEITIYYRKQTVLFAQLRGPKVQFHYNKEDPCLGPDGLVCFPGTEQLMDHRQIKYTQKLLNSIQRGLLLEVKPRGIYGTRLDKCHVYTAHNVPVIEEPSKLPNNREVELLSFQKYIKDLIDFKENKRGSPDYTIYLCFGEKFPDGKPKDTKLILVKVVPLVCRFWHEMAQREGASSLQSDNISLQLSNNSPYELINS